MAPGLLDQRLPPFASPTPGMPFVRNAQLFVPHPALARSNLPAHSDCLSVERVRARFLRSILLWQLADILRFLHAFGYLREVGGSRLEERGDRLGRRLRGFQTQSLLCRADVQEV